MIQRSEDEASDELNTSLPDTSIMTNTISKENSFPNGWEKENIKEIIKPDFLGSFGLKNVVVDNCASAFNLMFTEKFFIFLLNQINKRIVRKNALIIESGSKNDKKINTERDLIKELSQGELKRFIAINLYMGIVVQPEIKNYWSADTSSYGCKIVKDNMSYKRFTEINSNISLSSVNKNSPSKKRDIEQSTEKIISHLNKTFQKIYSPNQELSIDEGMCKYKGRYSFKTYMPLKPIKVGMKFYILTDSRTGYVYNFKLYTGKYSSINQTVLDLVSGLSNKNHTLYMDNYYNSYNLCNKLKTEGIYACGTMRMNRGEPDDFAQKKKKMKKGDLIFYQKNNINILLWYDKKVVCFISTFINFDKIILEGGTKALEKPLMIKDYDKNMGGVDKYDQMLKSYYNERKNKKWSNKLAIYLVNMMLHNSYIVYKHFSNEPKKIKKHLGYRKNIIKYLLKNSKEDDRTAKLNAEVKKHEGHWPKVVASKNRRDCVLCRSNGLRKTTTVYCVKCSKFLCVSGCFMNYHINSEESSSSEEELEVFTDN